MPHDDGDHQPTKRDLVWSEDRFRRGKQPNGYIWEVTEYGSDGMVWVKWHGNDPKGSDEEFEDISTAELDGKYHGHTLGYMLYSDDRYIQQK